MPRPSGLSCRAVRKMRCDGLQLDAFQAPRRRTGEQRRQKQKVLRSCALFIWCTAPSAKATSGASFVTAALLSIRHKETARTWHVLGARPKRLHSAPLLVSSAWRPAPVPEDGQELGEQGSSALLSAPARRLERHACTTKASAVLSCHPSTWSWMHAARRRHRRRRRSRDALAERRPDRVVGVGVPAQRHFPFPPVVLRCCRLRARRPAQCSLQPPNARGGGAGAGTAQAAACSHSAPAPPQRAAAGQACGLHALAECAVLAHVVLASVRRWHGGMPPPPRHGAPMPFSSSRHGKHGKRLAKQPAAMRCFTACTHPRAALAESTAL
ncbi:hypothetical protein FA09DRAFT_25668 [Tilletiopsis washingtonensis]|uniref:Uncharacterized protein n=1 Tax=Tilletiopsis washingtonensis TaxID=58919 RepID=A0A316ZBM0_9BASI|nr:hypothetical protein FA09DRAFT_25668 [Tilletiopsis washingtonensis]PWN98322.1 hypothetical protein FA09DRAFT_25668 [Tilletiopsis washingtonensis]